MHYVSLVWFLLLCPFLFLFLLRLGNSSFSNSCLYCNEKVKPEDLNCKKCGFEFVGKQKSFSNWLYAGGALACILSLVIWIESQKYLVN